MGGFTAEPRLTVAGFCVSCLSAFLFIISNTFPTLSKSLLLVGTSPNANNALVLGVISGETRPLCIMGVWWYPMGCGVRPDDEYIVLNIMELGARLAYRGDWGQRALMDGLLIAGVKGDLPPPGTGVREGFGSLLSDRAPSGSASGFIEIMYSFMYLMKMSL